MLPINLFKCCISFCVCCCTLARFVKGIATAPPNNIPPIKAVPILNALSSGVAKGSNGYLAPSISPCIPATPAPTRRADFPIPTPNPPKGKAIAFTGSNIPAPI